MAINRTPPLDERISNIRADINAYIDARVEEERQRCPGVPAGSLRISLTRGLGCDCEAYLLIKGEADKQQQREENAA